MSGHASSLRHVQPTSIGVHPLERACKLLLDVGLAGLALFITAPLMLLICVLIKLSDSGSVLYKQTRVGLGGRPFTCYKFRSMVLNADTILSKHLAGDPRASAEWTANQKLTADPRVTRFGHFLRTTSLDELPQLFNVISCDMSLVGPRPITEAELLRYGDKLALYLSVRPGLTGLWQISGRSNCTYEERVMLDTQYVSEWRFYKDIWILLQTVPAVLKGRGSC
jgi:exopolysaccharide production protein ExoY